MLEVGFLAIVLVFQLLVTFQNGVCEQLDYGHIFLERHITYLGPNFQNDEFHVDFSENFVLILLDDFQLCLLVDYGLGAFSLILVKTLFVEFIQNLVGRTFLPV